MSPVALCIKFLREIADVMEKRSPENDDPVGVIFFDNDGPKIYVPKQYVDAAATELKKKILVRSYEFLGYDSLSK